MFTVLQARGYLLITRKLNMVFCLDYDDTFTGDPELWTAWAKLAQERGHKIVCITGRRELFESRKEITEALPVLPSPPNRLRGKSMKHMVFMLCLVVLGCAGNTPSNSEPVPKVISVEKAAVHYTVIEPEIVGKKEVPHPAVVLLVASLGPRKSGGTAFFVKYRGRSFLITAKHCVIDSNTLSALSGAVTPVSFKIISHAFADDSDIAVFLVEVQSPIKFLELESLDIVQKIPENDPLLALPESWVPMECSVFGYPSDQGFRVSSGKITHRIDFTTCSYLVCTADSRNGMSGSPWVNKKTGKVVAVHVSTLGQGDNERAGGVSVEFICPVLDKLIDK